MADKLLSVLMPVARCDYNFKLTLRSVSQQSYLDFVLIIVCPIDIESQVRDLVKEIIRPPICCQILSTGLAGVAFAANLGLSMCNTKYIARWDSDDLCDETRLHEQIKILEERPDVAVVGTRVEIINETGAREEFQKFKFYETDREIRRALKFRQSLLHSSLTFRTDVLFEARGYLYGHTSEDHELFIRIARDKNIRFLNLSGVTTYYRRHGSQLSDISNISNQFYEISAFMFGEFLRTFNMLYIFGIIVNIPPIRKARYRYRGMRSFLKKYLG